MPAISGIETALPARALSREEIEAAGRRWLKDEPGRLDLFLRFLASTDNQKRHFALPIEEVLSQNGLSKRAADFERHGTELACAALARLLDGNPALRSDAGSLVFTSCSCPLIPSIDALVIERLEMPRNMMRMPVYQYGCAGGVAGLSLANQLASGGKPSILLSVELCSLVFQPQDMSPAQLVGAALFGDGAAALALTPGDEGFVIQDAQSFLLPQSRHLMGYDIFDDGFHLRLDRELPSVLAASVPALVREFLGRNDLSAEQVRWWLFHPGGMKIISFLEEIFDLDKRRCRWSRDVLRSVGNLSSATILFVLRDFLQAKEYSPGDSVLMMGIGPGLTVELVLLRANTN